MMSEKNEKILRQAYGGEPIPPKSEKIQDKNNVFRNIAKYIADRMDLRYNSVRLVTEFRYRGEEVYQIFSDRERASLLIEMKEERPFHFAKSDYELYISSGRVPEFDPYKSYLENLPPWDGEDRIKQIAEYIKVEDTPQYNFAWQFKKWLVRVVKCALEPNYFNKQILVLVGGEQNTGKTTFCRWLCPPELHDYWSEENPSGKDESIQLASNFYILYDELVKLNKASEAEIKTTLSKTIIKYRPPYARTEQNFTRRCSFMGTTNPTEFLTDPTGNVRFLAWAVKSIDFNYERIDRSQLYAQVYHLYKADFQCDMTNIISTYGGFSIVVISSYCIVCGKCLRNIFLLCSSISQFQSVGIPALSAPNSKPPIPENKLPCVIVFASLISPAFLFSYNSSKSRSHTLLRGSNIRDKRALVDCSFWLV